MNKLIVANWKLNPQTEAEAIKLAKISDQENVVVAAPFVFLEVLKKILKKAKLGAENSSIEESGAFTGEVSAKMLKNLGVSYVIIGHSERRKYFGETDEIVNKKLDKIISNELNPILCVGESLETRKVGIPAVKEFIKNQLNKDLSNIENSKLKIENLVIAYEPIWAIGAGIPDKPSDSAEIIKFIKEFVHLTFKISQITVLYGGSVNARNAEQFLSEKEIDGALVGGASLKPKEFTKILEIAKNK